MKWLLTCPSDGPNGGDGEALPAPMNVRRKPLTCLAAILKLLQNDSQATSGQLDFSRSQCLPSSFPPMRAAWLSLSTKVKAGLGGYATRGVSAFPSSRVSPKLLSRARVFCPPHHARRNQRLLAVLDGDLALSLFS